MDSVRFCRHCRELLEDRWIHCPWCGEEAPRSPESWGAMVEESMGRVEIEQTKGCMGILKDLSGRLDALEIELDAFLAGRVSTPPH